jgi:hypothetical protein
MFRPKLSMSQFITLNSHFFLYLLHFEMRSKIYTYGLHYKITLLTAEGM